MEIVYNKEYGMFDIKDKGLFYGLIESREGEMVTLETRVGGRDDELHKLCKGVYKSVQALKEHIGE